MPTFFVLVKSHHVWGYFQRFLHSFLTSKMYGNIDLVLRFKVVHIFLPKAGFYQLYVCNSLYEALTM